jgi:lysozyme
MNRFTPLLGLTLAAAALTPRAASADDAAGIPGPAASLSAMIDADSQISQTPVTAIYPVRGLDISHYQGTIAWNQVRTDGLSFIYVKATDGDETVDPEFVNNWEGAASAGLARGAYHFYDFCKDGAAQAAHFIATVPPAPGLLPPMVDLEKSVDCGVMPDKADFRPELAAFVASITAAYGRAPILYVNYQTYAAYLQGENDPYQLWITDPDHAAPTLPGWTLWQYSFNGLVPGIPNMVDLDVFSGGPAELAALAAPADGAGVAGR